MRVAVLALLVAGCVSVTINVSFPQEKLESAASSIEDLVGGGAGSPSKAPQEGAPPAPEKPQSLAPARGATWFGWLAPSVVEAQAVPELKTRTPEVMAAIESRRRRNAEIDRAERAGCLGENLQGLVEARPGQDCPSNLGVLVSGENGDRMFIYRTLVEQNNMPPADISRVQAAFAKTRREKAPPGTWIQLENGQWTRK